MIVSKLIPIEVKAMCLEENHNTKFAHISINYTNIGNNSRPYEPLENQSFTTTSFEDSAGIHLHWIMPDEFTQGTAQEDGTITYPRLPNKWIITRMYTMKDEIFSNRFIVNSNSLELESSEKKYNRRSLTFPYLIDKFMPYRYLGRSCWEEDKINSPNGTIEDLTALSSSSPYFTSYYHFCRNVFGFHDTLKIADMFHENVKMTYNVYGYYNYKDGKDTDKIFHGMITDILWPPKKEASYDTAMPQISVGNTSAEAISALHSNKNEEEMLSNAFLTDNLHKLNQRDGYKNVAQLIKASEFGTYKVPMQFAKQKASLSASGHSLDVDELNKKMDTLSKYDEQMYCEFRKIYDYLLGYQYHAKQKSTEIAEICKTKMKERENIVKNLLSKIKILQKEIERESEGLSEIPTQRFWIPNEPVIAIENLQRGVSYGYDGRYSNEEELEKRCPDEIITSLTLEDENIILYGTDFVKKGASFVIPEYLLKLEGEAILLSTSFSEVLAKKALGTGGKFEDITKLAEVIYHLQIAPFASLFLKAGLEEITKAAGFDGKYPSKVAVSYYTDKWNPLILEWSALYHADLGVLQEKPSLENWKFGENDYVYKYAYPDRSFKTSLQGRTVITPHLAETMNDMVEKQIGESKTEIKYADILSQALGGFYDQLLMRTPRVPQPVFVPEEIVIPKEYAQMGADKMVCYEDFFSPIRAGFLEIKRLRVIDSFGRFRDIPVKLSAVAKSMKGPVSASNENLLMLPPRILQGARISFNWNKKKDRSILGWLIPNYAENKLVFYNMEGKLVGELQHEQKKIIWKEFIENVPKEIISIASQFIGSEELKFDLFMKSIEEALTQINTPAGDDFFDSVSYVGPLVALASVSIGLELCTPMEEYKIPELIKEGGNKFRKIKLESAVFPGRIGEKNHNGDGVVGFFDETFNSYHTSFLSAKEVKKDSFFSDDICIELKPSYEKVKEININLLFYPPGDIHITTGILPQFSTSLSPQEVTETLEYMVYSIFTAPIISNAQNIVLPYPDTEHIRWNWLTPSKDKIKITNADQQALFDNKQMHLLEGWLCREDGE